MVKLAIPALGLIAAGAVAPSSPVAADPPSDARPLSEIAQALEQVPGYLFLQELKWDDAAEAWTAIYRVSNGMDKRILIDARTGAITEAASEAMESGAPADQNTDDEPAGTTESSTDDETLIPTPNGME
ncbi:PepSY domain-containing protein [Notoacmeibacter sp. MSK16QG-6]|uniref:PepSY domain-containing protein n=1 Tax=Notoacmeibacter sp. MSK16QG-6 TaxID=2957982 RepID=UPI0020A16689|nr:hypothetical protein [Notoacmeibacter sp. MSK16QG-6]MCP1198685.1 hypothetical protein [Notoacmeibacter sp. MSK16QG-6]